MVNEIGTPKLKEPEQTLEDEYKDLNLNLPVLEVLAHAPMYNAVLDKCVESLELGKNGFASIQGEMPEKIKDPGLFTLPYGTKSYPVGIVKNVKVHIGRLKLLEEFYVIDMEKDPATSLFVGRGFLATANAVIDCKKTKIVVGKGVTRLTRAVLHHHPSSASSAEIGWVGYGGSRVVVPDLVVITRVGFWVSGANFLLLPKRNSKKMKSIVKLIEECSDVIQRNLPQKEGNTRSFTLPCLIGPLSMKNGLADLGESINLMLGISELNLTRMSIQLADRSNDIEEQIDFEKVQAVLFYPRKVPTEPLEWKALENRLKPSIKEPPKVELKELPDNLQYAFLQKDDQFFLLLLLVLPTTTS
nr:hypothetical protein [Tanacetum cinerariifolium]